VGFRLLVLPLAALLVAACTSGGSPGPPTQPNPSGPVRSSPASAASWPLFGYDAARSNTFDGDPGIAARDLGQLRREQVELPGTADSSPIYVRGRLLVTTSYGKVAAIDPSTGSLDWTFVPDGIQSWEGTSQITQSSPAADPEEGYVYSYSPDGKLHKLSIGDGHELRSEGWPAVLTRDPVHEKVAPALNLVDDMVLVATGGYFGDAPPYQGHVVAVDRRSGRLVNVFNTLCSDREGLLDPASCPESGSAVWGRGGVVVDPESGNLLVATGDGEWDGTAYWGDSVLVLSPDAGELYASYTPDNEQALDDGDVDLASGSPAVVPPHFVVQGGKDGLVRLLDLGKLGRGAQGHEADVVDAPGGEGVFTAPAVWRTSSATWIFIANAAGTAGYVLGDSTLDQRWEAATPGTSPVLAGGLLYVYDPGGSGLHVYDPRTGQELGVLPAGRGHWNSPIVVDGVIALPEGDANDQYTRGILNIYRLP
jgi:outer membrane protein assembly factor BamB